MKTVPDPALAMSFAEAVERWMEVAPPQPSPNIRENAEVFGEGEVEQVETPAPATWFHKKEKR